LKGKIVSLSLLALCLSVLSCANCHLPFAICQCFVEEEDEEWGHGGWKGQRWTLMRERINLEKIKLAFGIKLKN